MVETDWAARLQAAVAEERRVAEAHAACVADRDRVFAEAVGAGLTYYRIHQITGLAQSAVRKSVDRARDAQQEVR